MSRNMAKTVRLTEFESGFLDFLKDKTLVQPATFIAKATKDAIHSDTYSELRKEFEASLSNAKASVKIR